MIDGLINSLTYSLLGIFILIISFWIIERITPQNLYKKLVDENNTAVAIMGAAFIIGIAIIVSSAIRG